ncbi:MAG TPA: outer membrane lipoprotein-sorting protein [Pyrinomonadaceae bacterium]|nr:outer membrane lipoprotein-sorting protein [Pyrinomonadaceae bacterium]
MNHRTLIQTLLLSISISVVLSGCRQASVTNDSTPPSVNTGSQLPEPEKVYVKKAPERDAPSASKLVDDYNARNFGSPGWRRVLLELMTDDTVTRTFTVVNLWRSDNDAVRTLFLLEEPQGLSGTNYLLQEERDKPPEMQVHLFLPAGERRVLEVAPGNFSEGLLGSDFSYQDVRMQLPVKGYRYSLKGGASLLNEPAWVVEVEPSTDQTREINSWSTAQLYLARNFPFLLGADFYGKPENETGPPHLLKQMRVQGLKQIDGVWTATRIAMYGQDKHASVLTLKEAGFNSAEIDSGLFSPKELPGLSERVRQGWTLEIAPVSK